MQIKYTLSEDHKPKAWYNIQADLLDYHAGLLCDSEYSDQEIAMALAGLPIVS
ncbi:hypothetical protein [Coleofasciculus sp. G2-EDA-02]|uniref:hypothetical protein n=1 Tax=Coleofasciculus sp. G2-EDA-02 TaxID=3069529 RepID=UPI00330047FF